MMNSHDYSACKSYNDVPCREDEVLVPFLVPAIEIPLEDLNRSNLVLWPFRGRRLQVGFVPVRCESFEEMLTLFNEDVRRYLSRNKPSNEVSLDALLDAQSDEDSAGFDPTGSAEQEEELLLELKLEAVLRQLDEIDPRYSSIIRLLRLGYGKGEVARMLGLGKKSTAYDTIRRAQDAAEIIYYK